MEQLRLALEMHKMEKMSKKAHFQCHFLHGDHAGILENVDISLINKTDGSDPSQSERY